MVTALAQATLGRLQYTRQLGVVDGVPKDLESLLMASILSDPGVL